MTHQYMEIKIKELEKRIEALEQEPCSDAIRRQNTLDAFGLSERKRSGRMNIQCPKDLNTFIIGTPFFENSFDKKECEKFYGDCHHCFASSIAKRDEQLRPKTGHWIHRNDDYNDWLECSKCGYGSEGEVAYGVDTPFCANCGAKMEGVEE